MISPSWLFVRRAVAVGVVAAALSGQVPPVARGDLSVAPPSLVVQDGVLWGLGCGYRARFDTDGVLELVPALGARASHDRGVALALSGMRRGEQPCDGIACSARPVVAGEREVHVDRGAGVTEIDRLRAEGVEQSFVFDSEPAGDGALVVTLRVDTDLPAARHDAAGVDFVEAGLGGVHIGAVLGRDAAGRTVSGTLRLRGNRIDLSLPSDFVSTARYPLELDPLVGTVFPISGGANDAAPDVAYDSASGTYLVVWQRVLSAADSDVLAQRIDFAGKPIGPLVTIRTGNENSIDPAVADVRSVGRFVVTWSTSSISMADVRVVAVDAATGATSPPVTLTSTGGGDPQPTVAGDATATGRRSLVVWSRLTTDGRVLDVPASGPPSVLGSFTLGSGSYAPVLSKSGGANGHYMLTLLFDIFGLTDGYCTVLDANGNTLVPLTQHTVNPYVTANAVDGVDDAWLVAWEESESPTARLHDLYCRTVHYDGSGLVLGGVVAVAATPKVDEVDPALAFAGGAYVFGYCESQDAFVMTLNPSTCTLCEPRQLMEGGSGIQKSVAAASERSSSTASASRRAVLAFSSVGRIVGRSDRSAAGPIVDVGGGCGQGGRLQAQCARIGNGAFGIDLSGARPLAPAVLVLSATLGGYACGPCTLQPALGPGSVAVSPGSTGGAGAIGFALPIPPTSVLVGGTLWAQWATVPLVPACVLGVDLSNGVSITIGG